MVDPSLKPFRCWYLRRAMDYQLDGMTTFGTKPLSLALTPILTDYFLLRSERSNNADQSGLHRNGKWLAESLRFWQITPLWMRRCCGDDGCEHRPDMIS